MSVSTHKTKVLFCGYEFPHGHRLTREELADDLDIEVVSCSRGEVVTHVADAHILVPLMTRIDTPLIQQAKQARMIIQYGVGLEGVDMDAASEAGIYVTNIPSSGTGNAVSCAEHIIYLILALLRDQNGMRTAVQEALLGQPLGRMLMGLRVLIIGFGNIGVELVPRLKPFGVHLTAVRASDWEDHSNCAAASLLDETASSDRLLEVLPLADVVVLTCTQNESTKGMVGSEFLSAMKPGAGLINSARGGLLQYHPVLEALESGHLGGLATDVMFSEPMDPSDPIMLHPKVIVTPHVAGITDVSYGSMAKIVAQEARRIHAGQPPSRVLNSPKVHENCS